jgi:hypothetical protein
MTAFFTHLDISQAMSFAEFMADDPARDSTAYGARRAVRCLVAYISARRRAAEGAPRRERQARRRYGRDTEQDRISLQHVIPLHDPTYFQSRKRRANSVSGMPIRVRQAFPGAPSLC